VFFICSLCLAKGAEWVQIIPANLSPRPSGRYYFGFAPYGSGGLINGGFNFDFLNDTWYFSAAPGGVGWTGKETLNSRAYSTLNTYGNAAYLFGGVGSISVAYNDLWQYSFATNTWTQIEYVVESIVAPLLVRQYHAADILGDILYVVGGFVYGEDPPRSANDVLAYNISTSTWSLLYSGPGASGPAIRQGHTANAFIDPIYGTSIVTFGGYTVFSNGSLTGGYADVWQYIVSSGEWIELSSGAGGGPAGRYGHNSALIGNTLYIYGGLSTAYGTPNIDTYYGDTWALSLGGGGAATWATVLPDSGTGPGRRQGHRGGVVNGQFYTVGGYEQDIGFTNDVWALGL